MNVLGIDFGTTNTIISCYGNDEIPVALTDPNTGANMIPTALYFETKERYKIGAEALNAERRCPSACVKRFKPLFQEKGVKIAVTAENGEMFMLRPQEAAQKFLVKAIAAAAAWAAHPNSGVSDLEMDTCIVTVPAKFSPAARAIIKNAVRMAASGRFGENVYLMNEPTAAALAYIKSHHDMENANVLVYDFGGGTFDVSVVGNQKGICTQYLQDGIPDLGGNNLTDLIAASMIETVNEDYGDIDLNMPTEMKMYSPDICRLSRDAVSENLATIWAAAENLKIKMGFMTDFELEEDLTLLNTKTYMPEKRAYEWYITTNGKNGVDELLQDPVMETVKCAKRVIEDAGKKGIKITHVILAGGSSLLPAVRNTLRNELMDLVPAENILFDTGTATLISRGAVYGKEEKGVSYTTESIGFPIRQEGVLHAFKTAVPTGVELPYKSDPIYVIIPDDDDEISLPLYMRNEARADGRAKINDFSDTLWDEMILKNLPAGRDRQAKFIFHLLADGTLEIKATITKDGDQRECEHTVVRGSNLD